VVGTNRHLDLVGLRLPAAGPTWVYCVGGRTHALDIIREPPGGSHDSGDFAYACKWSPAADD